MVLWRSAAISSRCAIISTFCWSIKDRISSCRALCCSNIVRCCSRNKSIIARHAAASVSPPASVASSSALLQPPLGILLRSHPIAAVVAWSFARGYRCLPFSDEGEIPIPTHRCHQNVANCPAGPGNMIRRYPRVKHANTVTATNRITVCTLIFRHTLCSKLFVFRGD